MEIWKDVVGFERAYQVSNLGRVKRKICKGVTKERLLKSFKNDRGFEVVDLWANNKRKRKRVHRLVAEAFIANPEHKQAVLHKDGDRLNNKVDNLKWWTAHGRSKPVKCLDTGETFASAKEAARSKGCCSSSITNVVLGKRNKAGGLRWSYDFGGEE